MTTKTNENETADQGFNESELEDIMNEIESLEKEFTDVEEAPSAPIAASANPEALIISPKEVQKTSLQASIDEELEKLHSAPKPAPTSSNVVSMSAPKAPVFSGKGAKSEMSFSVAGEMAINLQFKVSGQCVNIEVDEQNGLVINLGNGGRFVLPINTNKAA
jgi:hypothetical protein